MIYYRKIIYFMEIGFLYLIKIKGYFQKVFLDFRFQKSIIRIIYLVFKEAK
jgi:hypothetical protein